MTILTTPRLSIEKVTQDDSAFIFELMNTPTWIQYIGDRSIKSIADATAYIETNYLTSYKENGYGLYKMVLTSTLAPIGMCGFVKRDYLDAPDIGFAVLPAYEGMGYTSEAATKILDYGLHTLNLELVLGITSLENIRSQRLLEKLGLIKQGTIQSAEIGKTLYLYSTQPS